MTAATAALSPEPLPGSGPGATADDTDFDTWERQLATAGNCTHPIRLRGRIDAIDLTTGELAPSTTPPPRMGECCTSRAGTAARRSARPAPQVYKRDARQLVRAGLAGGKGIPDTITAHPCVFATLTAPSFGPVHSRRMRGKTVLPCRPRRDAKAAAARTAVTSPARPAMSRTIPASASRCARTATTTTAAVLFNAYAGDLWRRFITYLPRHLARRLGITQKHLRAVARIRYVKVAEYQARGVVHFHAVIRLDAARRGYQPPPAGITAAHAVRRHRPGRRRRPPRRPGRHRMRHPALTFGTPQGTDVRPIRAGSTWRAPGRPLNDQAVANYIAKYATKTLTAPGVPSQRLRHLAEVQALRCSAHYKQMITTAWQLGGKRQTGEPRLRQWAHMLGYGGHFLTKSRRYSVTFGQLRAGPRRPPPPATSSGRRTRPLGPSRR